jgi:hypothetical protein
MTISKTRFNDVKKAFNELKVTRGQYTNIATSNMDGTPNVAPIGSMRVVDEHTVRVLQGFLPRTLANLRKNPQATFSVCLRQSLVSNLKFFGKKDSADILGYQIYCTYKGESDIKEDLDAEITAISNRVPFFVRGPFRTFCNKNLKRVLMFDIKDIRAIGAPEQGTDFFSPGVS